MIQNVRFTSDFRGDVSAVFYTCVLSLVILLAAAFECLYALMLNLPFPIMLIFIFGFLVFVKQSLDLANAVSILSRMVVALNINKGELYVTMVPNRGRSFGHEFVLSLRRIDCKRRILIKLLPYGHELIEIMINNYTCYMSVSNDEKERLLTYAVG